MATTDEEKFSAEVVRLESLNTAFSGSMSGDETADVTLPDGTVVPSTRKFAASVIPQHVTDWLEAHKDELATGGSGSLDPDSQLDVEVEGSTLSNSLASWIALFAGFAKQIENVEALRSLVPDFSGQEIRTEYHTYRGYGGGLYRHDPVDTTSEDNGGSVIVTTNGARWKRVWGSDDGTNVIDWGADPTGNTDAGPVCRAMLAAGLRVLYFPNYRFMIDTTVRHDVPDGDDGRTKPVQIKLRGEMWDNWGGNQSYACVFAGPNLAHDPTHDDEATSEFADSPDNPDGKTIGFSDTGWMFYNVQAARWLSFAGNGTGDTGACGVRTNGYVARIHDCAFHNFRAALGQLTCDSRVMDCNITNCHYAAYSVAGLATTVTFERVQMQYVNTCLQYTGQLVGLTFVDNIWEACGPGPWVQSAIQTSCAFYGNWVEASGGTDEDGNPTPLFIVRDSQQTNSNWAGSNSFHIGNQYVNPFEPPITDEGYSQTAGRWGGVAFDKSAVQVNNGTGNSTRLDDDGLTQRLDGWSGWNHFRIESGHNHHGAPALQLRASGTIEMTGRSDLDTGDATAFDNEFRFLKDAQVTTDGDGKKTYGDGLYESLKLHRDPGGKMAPGLIGKSPLPDGAVALTSVPLEVYCRDGGLQRGQEAFVSIDRSTAGQVVFEAGFSIENPIVTVTVEDRGIICDGWLLSGANGETSSNGKSRWRNYLTVYFVDRETGEATTPTGFCMRLSTHP